MFTFSSKPLISSSTSTSLPLIPFQFQFQFQFQSWLGPRFPSYSTRTRSRVTNAVRIRGAPLQSPVLLDSLKALKWQQLCECVASFAVTPLGKEALLAQMMSLDLTYEESVSLQDETDAMVAMLNCGIDGLDFSSLDLIQVKTCIQNTSKGMVANGCQLMATTKTLEMVDTMQTSLRACMQENSESTYHFEPLSDMVLSLNVDRALIRSVAHVLDHDGKVKDSASRELRHYRNQVCQLEKKLQGLMTNLTNGADDFNTEEASTLDGRYCRRITHDQVNSTPGLLFRSGSGADIYVETAASVLLNDELVFARAMVAKSEFDVLTKLTDKVKEELDNHFELLDSIVFLDMISSRAKYSVSFGGVRPYIMAPCSNQYPFDTVDSKSLDKTYDATTSSHNGKEWALLLQNLFHPLLLVKYREHLNLGDKDTPNVNFQEHSHPVPVDFRVDQRTKVFVLTGPNMGGKTIFLGSVAFAALMSKTGLYVLASDPAVIPWFDYVFADIGDRQSIIESLSTFSGWLKQITAITSESTKDSLVLLDEVGAGTNPMEGAALGMAILEALSEDGAYLTLAATHHGELKTLKYSNMKFENACAEFDEVNLRPTYKILWGIPGRSNAMNVADKAGLPKVVLDSALASYGVASAKINEAIFGLELFKQELEFLMEEAKDHFRTAKEIHGALLSVNHKIRKHQVIERSKKMKEISESVGVARSNIQKTYYQARRSMHDDFRSRMIEKRKPVVNTSLSDAFGVDSGMVEPCEVESGNLRTSDENSGSLQEKNTVDRLSGDTVTAPSIVKSKSVLAIGDTVTVPALGKKVKVVDIDPARQLVVVQLSNMKLRLRFSEINS